MAGKKGKNGGRRKGAGRKKGDPNNRGRAGKSPEDFMKSLVPVGPVIDHGEEGETIDADFTVQRDYVDPVTFCQAVINHDPEILLRCGVNPGDITHVDKLFAAKIAVKYTNKPQPVETITKHQHSWAESISQGEQRVKNLRKDLENDDAPATVN